METTVEEQVREWFARYDADATTSIGPLDDLFRAVIEGRVSIQWAISEAYGRKDRRNAEFPQYALAAEIIRVFCERHDTKVAAIVARLQLAAVAALASEDVVRYGQAYLLASNSFVRAVGEALGPDGFDVVSFREVEKVGEEEVRVRRSGLEAALALAPPTDLRGQRVRLALALRSLALARRAMIDQRLPSYWEKDGPWRANVLHHAHELPAGWSVEDYRLVNAETQFDRAVGELQEAEDLFAVVGDARAANVRSMRASLLKQMTAWRPAVKQEAVRELRALEQVAWAENLEIKNSVQTLLLSLGQEPISVVAYENKRRAGGRDHESYADDVLSRLSAIRIARGPMAAATVYFTEVDGTVRFDDLNAFRREQWMEFLLHTLDGTIVCSEGRVEIPREFSAWTDRQAYFRAHAAAHVAEAADAIAALDGTDATNDLTIRLTTYCRAVRGAELGKLRAQVLGLTPAARDLRRAIADALAVGADELAANLLRWLEAELGAVSDNGALVASAQVMGALAPTLDYHASFSVRAAFRACGAVAERGGEATTRSLVQHRWVFSGAAFGSMVSSPRPFVLDVDARSLLRRSNELEKSFADVRHAPVFGDPFLDEEHGRLALFDPREKNGGGDPAEQLANLRRQFERQIGSSAVHSDDDEDIVSPATDAIGFAASGKTAVWDMSSGRDHEGHIIISSTLWRRGPGLRAAEVVARSVARFAADKLIWTSPDGFSTRIEHPAAALVAKARAALREQPRHRDVSPDAEDALYELAELYLPDFAEPLRRLNEGGCDHLCVRPTGPLTFAPIHLFIATSRRPLADTWTVTIVPSFRMLAARATPVPHSGLVAVAAPNGGVAFGMQAVPELIDQVVAIASQGTARIIPESDATPTAVLDAASHSRYLHIAAHGSDYAPAPSFQCLYLSTAGGADGRLFAYDVLQADLRSVELVSLSACESALGRVDDGDNLYGMVGAFLRAGARTVIAALWPVAPDASATFFRALYGRLQGETGVLEAFRYAQLCTRKSHPGYRDWGAFVVFGHTDEGER